MKGDFSRLTFDRKKHYSDVLMQQGRVLVDADWNEQQRIHRYRVETEAADVLGPSGVPAVGGLKITHSSAARSLSVVKAAQADVLKGWIVGANASILHWNGQSLHAQTAPSGVNVTLRAVFFIDEKNGWAAGDEGILLHTDNGGAKWNVQKSGTDNDLLAVYFQKAGRECIGCAVGTWGTLLYTRDGGKNWFKQSTGVKAQLNAVHIMPFDIDKGIYKIFAAGQKRTILEYTWNMKDQKLKAEAVEFEKDTSARPDLYSVNSAAVGKKELACAVGEDGAVFSKGTKVWQAQTSGVTVALKSVLVVPSASTPFKDFPYILAAIGEDGTACFSADGSAWWVFRTKLSEKVQAVNFIDYYREQSPAIMTLLGNQGGVFNQAATGWSRFIKLITRLATSGGRIYVDGILCEFEEPATLPMPAEAGKYLVYLDCWRRHITAAQDPQIRETALCGPDTCTRVQTISRVKYLPVVSAEAMEKVEELRVSAREIVQKIGAGFTRAQSDDQEILNAAAAAMEKMVDLADDEVPTHLGVNALKIKYFVDTQNEKLSVAAREKVKDKLDAWAKIQTDIVEIVAQSTVSSAWEKLTAAKPCALAASVKKGDTKTNLCSITAGGGYTGLENQLYRVEIHNGSTAKGGPTFKWSRDNGSVIFPFEIVTINDKKTMIRLTTQDLGSYYPVSKEEWIDAWVEVQNDDDELAGDPGLLMRIADVPSDTEMILDGLLDTTLWSNKSKHPIIRRWDQSDDAKMAGAVAVAEDAWLDLESGVRIRFEKDGYYKTGDYWMIPARTDLADVEWPKNGDESIALPPAGIRHHYARLALLTASPTGKDKMIVTEFHDCRDIFEPITNHALHITGINWKNDSQVEFNDAFYANLVKVGFQIILDDAPDAWTVNESTLIVTAEMDNGLGYRIVDGVITVRGNIITWRAKSKTKSRAPINLTHMDIHMDSGILHNSFIAGVTTAGSGGATTTPATTTTYYRIRITLKGRLIWKTCCGGRIYLDGQVFGKPRNDKDTDGNAVVRHDLDLPSGAGNRGSDFESWFNVYQITNKSRSATGPSKDVKKRRK